MTVRISVVIPCYKQAHFLGKAIQSVLSQERDDVEIIVVNDGSPDNTSDVAREFGNKIVYLEQENLGLSGARNTGIRAARGEYVAFLDSDDQYLPGALTAQATYLDLHPETAFVCGDSKEYLDPDENYTWLNSSYMGPPHNQNDFRWETVFFLLTPSTIMMRRSAFNVTGYFDERLRTCAEDWLMGIQVARCFEMAYLHVPLMLRRIHPESTTRKIQEINHGNRLAIRFAVESPNFLDYPSFYRAQLLYVYCAMYWHVRPRAASLQTLWQAFRTHPGQSLTPLRILWRRFRASPSGRKARKAWRRARGLSS